MKILQLLLITSVLGTAGAKGAPVEKAVYLGEVSDSFEVSSNLITYFEDQSGIRDLRAVSAEKFEPLSDLQFPSSDATRWIKFAVYNDLQVDFRYFVKINAPIRDVRVFFVNNSVVDEKTSGLSQPLSRRDQKNKDYLFLAAAKPKEKIVIFIRATSPFPMNLQPVIYPEKKVYEEDRELQLFYGFYIGLIFATAFLNLVIWLWTRDKVYLAYFCVSIFSHSLGVASIYGIANEYLFFDSPSLATYSILVILSLMLVASVWFTQNFLDTPSKSPWVHKYLNLLIGILVCSALWSLFDLSAATADTLDILSAVTILSTFGAGVISLFRGYVAGRYFVFSWGLFLAGASTYIAQDNALIGVNFFTKHSIMIGAALESLVFSLALGGRFFNTRKLLNRYRGNLSSLVTSGGHDDALEKVVFDSTPKALELSVMFIDVVEFSTIMEMYKPVDVFERLRAHLHAVRMMVHKHHGIIVGTGGDSVLCVFGYDPIRKNLVPGHEKNALNCALEFQHIFIEKILRRSDKDPVFPVRIGIETDRVLVGDLGDETNADITILGDTVNFASRLESSCSPMCVMIGSRLRDAIKESETYFVRQKYIKIKHHKELVVAYEAFDGNWRNSDFLDALRILHEYLQKSQAYARVDVSKLGITVVTSYENYRVINVSKSGFLLEGQSHYFANGVELEVQSILVNGTPIVFDSSNLVFPFQISVRWGSFSEKYIRLGTKIELHQEQLEFLYSQFEDLIERPTVNRENTSAA